MKKSTSICVSVMQRPWEEHSLNAVAGGTARDARTGLLVRSVASAVALILPKSRASLSACEPSLATLWIGWGRMARRAVRGGAAGACNGAEYKVARLLLSRPHAVWHDGHVDANSCIGVGCKPIVSERS